MPLTSTSAPEDIPPQPYEPDPNDPLKKKSDDDSGVAGLLKKQQSSIEKYGTKLEELQKKREDITDKAINETGGLADLQRQYMAAAGQRIGVPRDPRFKVIPDAPQPEFRDPFNAFGNPLVVMATLGGLFTRTPAIAALNAGAAAMNAYHEGDQEKIELTRKNFEDRLKVVQAQNQQQVDLFNAQMQKSHLSMQEKMTNMSAIAHAFQNKEVIAAFQTGNVDAAFKVIDGMMTAQNQLNQEIMRYNEFQQRQRETETSHVETEEYRREALAERRREADQTNALRMEAIRQRGAQGGMTGNQYQRAAAHINQFNEGLTGIDNALDLLNKHVGIAGVAGKATRLGETVGNIFGSNATDRREFESTINELQMIMPQLLLDRTGRPLSAEAGHIATIVRGLNAGDTTANTIRRLQELRERLARMQDRSISLLEGTWTPEGARYGGTGGGAPAGGGAFRVPGVSVGGWRNDPVVGE